MLIVIRLGQWWVCLQQNHGNKQPSTFSHEYYHLDSHLFANGKDRSKQHSFCSIEEAYYLVEGMWLCLSFLLTCCFGVLAQKDDVIKTIE
jgi:hypothetical protein